RSRRRRLGRSRCSRIEGAQEWLDHSGDQMHGPISRRDFLTAAALALGAFAASGAQDAPALRGATPPPNGFWVDSLDLAKVAGTRLPRPGQAAVFVRPRPGEPQPAPLP